MIRAIAAIDDAWAVGLDDGLPWHDRDDLRHFRSSTMGSTVLVGRKTFDTLPTLKGRQVLYMTRDEADTSPAACHSITEVLLKQEHPDLWIAGGPEVWALWAERIEEWVITRIAGEHEADTFFDPLLLMGRELDDVQGRIERWT